MAYIEYARLSIPVKLPANVKKVEYAEVEDSKIQCITTVIDSVVDGREQYTYFLTDGAIPTVGVVAGQEGSVTLALTTVV